jgi:hypothetical protein
LEFLQGPSWAHGLHPSLGKAQGEACGGPLRPRQVSRKDLVLHLSGLLQVSEGVP